MKIYEPVHAQFERFCKARVYGDMQHGDLMNDTLITVYQKFDNIKDKGKILSFLIGTSIKILANSNRKQKAETGVIDLNSSLAIATHNTSERIETRMLYEAIAKLPEEQRESIILFEITGYSIKEIADLHKVGESAVKQRLRRGRIKLQELLDVKNENKEHYG